MDKYEFNAVKHVHTLNGERLSGVTTILAVIAKPALIQWAADMAVNYIRERIFDFDIDTIANKVLPEARLAHRKKKEDAGAKGTDIHAEVETLIVEAIKSPTGQIGAYRGDSKQVQHFVKWAEDNKAVFKESELNVYSKEWWVGGIVDFIVEVDGDLWLGDIKTSSGIYPEHFFQTAAYQKMCEEMGLYTNFKGNLILNLRKDGTFEEKRSISNEDNLLAFTSALNIYRVQNKIKGNILK